MLDEAQPKGRLIAAAMRLAAERPWQEIALAEIAAAAGMDLAALRELHVGSKADLVAGFMRAADGEILRKSTLRTSEPARDRLFDVIMRRFDTLLPWKASLKSIAAAGLADPALAGPFFASQHWMLQAAGIGTDGSIGRLKVAGLASVYAATFRSWLDDDDPGMAKTMAALDRRLRRGEGAISSIEGTCNGAIRIAHDLPAVLGSLFKRRPDATAANPAADPDPGAR